MYKIAGNQAGFGFRTKRGANPVVDSALELLEVKELFAGSDELARSV
jgi:hypothetical protein